ncbi:hypothetical protein LTS18_003533 [Coniosporium uncinatum]|uniref:Uncharacterized protein n=1 Tax=Coniosporium uncinatum TaxID=93489 RepID=A0ACC3DTJ8_9PEZI|nr:hypothetical protein LTS18_003533 [Coniosporium uncinatum]
MSLTPYRPTSFSSNTALQRFSPKEIGFTALFSSSSTSSAAARRISAETFATSLLYHLLSTLLQQLYNLVSEAAINLVNEFFAIRRQKLEEGLSKKSEILQRLRDEQIQNDTENPHAVTEAVKSAVAEHEDAEREEFEAWRAARKASAAAAAAATVVDSEEKALDSDRTRGIMCPLGMRGGSMPLGRSSPRFGLTAGWGPRARMHGFFDGMPRYNTISECTPILPKCWTQSLTDDVQASTERPSCDNTKTSSTRLV